MLPWLSAGFAIWVSQILCFIAGSAEPFIRQRPSGVGNRMVLIGMMERDLHWYKFFPSCNTEHSARVMMMEVKRSCAMSHPLLCLHWPSLSHLRFFTSWRPQQLRVHLPCHSWKWISWTSAAKEEIENRSSFVLEVNKDRTFLHLFLLHRGPCASISINTYSQSHLYLLLLSAW